jgi:hypothetical protein
MSWITQPSGNCMLKPSVAFWNVVVVAVVLSSVSLDWLVNCCPCCCALIIVKLEAKRMTAIDAVNNFAIAGETNNGKGLLIIRV